MANFYSSQQGQQTNPFFAPQTNPWSGQLIDLKNKPNQGGQEIRYFEATYVVPTPAPAIGDKILWGKLPVRARVLGDAGKLQWSLGNASSTITLGDTVSAARHLAATSVATAGSATPAASRANGATFETSTDVSDMRTGVIGTTDDCMLISTVAGAALLPGQIITLSLPFVTL
jgi:hypothetical protein